MSSSRILIVEDNPSDIFLLRRAFAKREEIVEIEFISDGEQAIDFVRSQRNITDEAAPCVILLDLHLPKFGGLEILRAIREEPVFSNEHVVVMTNLASPREEAELRAMGADYRLKPKTFSDYEKLAADLIAICTSAVL